MCLAPNGIAAALKIGLDKDFGLYKVGFFARGEFYSYAPMIHYNEDGPHIGKGDAWSGSLGARVDKVPSWPLRSDRILLGHLKLLEERLGSESAPAYISTREVQEKLVAASVGFDIPPFKSWFDFKIWEEESPPKGTIIGIRRATT